MEKRIANSIMSMVNDLSDIQGLNYQKLRGELLIVLMKEIQKYNNTQAIIDAIEDIKVDL